MAAERPPYPVRFSVDYPERVDRLSTAFRLIWIIPIGIVLAVLEGGSDIDPGDTGIAAVVGGSGLVFFPPLLMILFRQKYPRWWFDWNLELFRFSARVVAYGVLLRDEYPSTDEQQSVHLDIDYPDVERDLTRWMPLVKWLLAIPHVLVLLFLVIATFFVVVFAWFAILFTGRYPRRGLRLRRRCRPLGLPGPGVRLAASDRPLSAIQRGAVGPPPGRPRCPPPAPGRRRGAACSRRRSSATPVNWPP